MSNLAGTKDVLAQLDALKAAAADFAAREEKLQTALREQSGREKKSFDAANQQWQGVASARVTAAENDFSAVRRRLEFWFSQRQQRINRVHHRVRELMSSRLDDREEKCKTISSQGLIEAERLLAAHRTEAQTNFNNFPLRHEEVAAEFQELEKRIRKQFGFIGGYRRLLSGSSDIQHKIQGSGYEMLDEAAGLAQKISVQSARATSSFKYFRLIIVLLVACLLTGVAASLISPHSAEQIRHLYFYPITIGLLGVLFVAYCFQKRAVSPQLSAVAADFCHAKGLVESAPAQSAAWHDSEQTRIMNEFESRKNYINSEWKREIREIQQARGSRPVELESRIANLEQRNSAFFKSRLQQIQLAHENVLSQLGAESAQKSQLIAATHQEKLSKLQEQFQNDWQKLEADWKHNALPLWETIHSEITAAENDFPGWSAQIAGSWKPPTTFLNAARFGKLEIETQKFFPALPKDPRLALPCPALFSIPLLLTHPQQGSLLIETNKVGDAEAVAAMNNLILRLLATTPPGRVEFTIFDPVGLGQNFATLMHLADYEAGSINSRIWTQTGQFEEKLADLSERMEKIIQMYLRNEYATIAEYNAQAGSTAEKYHVLVIASFPVNFSDLAAKRLRNIAASGARCGVFTLVHWDHRNAAPQDFVPDELRNNSVCLIREQHGFEFAKWRAPGIRIELDAPPSAEFATDLLHRIGHLGKDANRVEVPFESVAPPDAEMWSEETREVLRVPIGRSGATKFQYLEIGKGTRQHALIAGKTGSGKSTLFHVIITNLALRCSPEEVEFYLVDFKKGVEFKCYGNRRLPHARVVAIESDREFGLSVLQRVDDELRRRGDAFRKVGAQDLAGYKRLGGTEIVPRTLLMIDEFQEFFTEEDRISQGAAVLLDRIVRQGRAFGIHVILGSQTLGGAYTLARATIGQMVIRIALQCNEADAYLIMDQDNPAPRLLSRPGEGIYNDAAGALEGNSPFQAVWLSDKTRDSYLEKIRARADMGANKFSGPIVFEGNAPADVRENVLLQSALGKTVAEIPALSRVWLGAPNSIKGPTEAVFQRQSGSNLLIVGQSEERTATILSVSLVALAAQFPRGNAKFFVLDGTPPGFPQRETLEQICKAVPQEIVLGNNGNLPEVMATLAEEFQRRAENESAGPEIFLLIQGLQHFKKLRQEDEFSFSSGGTDAPSPAVIFTNLITEGPARGIHVIAACDTFNNVGRFIGRKGLTEFEMRVLFQMSAADSASLIDSPNASTLGLHRAIMFNERESVLETFRPYAPPDGGWLEEAAQRLKS